MTKVNIRTVSYAEWQKRMFKALKDIGVEQWVGYEKAKKQVEKDLERESQVENLKRASAWPWISFSSSRRK